MVEHVVSNHLAGVRFSRPAHEIGLDFWARGATFLVEFGDFL